MAEGFLHKPGVLRLFLRKYEHGEIDDRWREYLENTTAIKFRSRGVRWSTSVSMTEEGSLKLTLAVGFTTDAGDMTYRVLDKVQILGVTEKDKTTFVSVINTVTSEPAILIVRFEDVNHWDAQFLLEQCKHLPPRWCTVVSDVVSPVVDRRVKPPSLEEMFATLNLVADALFREFCVGGEEAMTNFGEGTSNTRKRRLMEKDKCEERGAPVDKPAATPQRDVRVGLQTPGRRDAPRSALVVDLTPAATTMESEGPLPEESRPEEMEDRSATPLKKKLRKDGGGRSGRPTPQPTSSLATSTAVPAPSRQSAEAGRANSGVVFAVPAPRAPTTPTSTPTVAVPEGVNAAAASATRSNSSAAQRHGQTAAAAPQSSGRIHGMKLKTMKTKGKAKRRSEASQRNDARTDGEGTAGNESAQNENPSATPTAADGNSREGESSPLPPSRTTESTLPARDPSPVRELAHRIPPRRLPLVRQRIDLTWTSYPRALSYDSAKEKTEISCAVYKKPPSKGDRDEKSYMDLRMKHNLDFKTKVEYMYLFGYEQHFQLPLDRMRPVNQETEGLMVYRKLEKDGITIVYEKMSTLQFQKQVFTVMPNIRSRPRSWGEICDDVEFIIINGQHTWAAAKELIARSSVPDQELVDRLRLWECKVVWTTNHDHLHSLSYLCNDSSSGDAICSSTPSAIMHCRALWEDAGKPAQVRKNAARGGGQDGDTAARRKWEVRVEFKFPSDACISCISMWGNSNRGLNPSCDSNHGLRVAELQGQGHAGTHRHAQPVRAEEVLRLRLAGRTVPDDDLRRGLEEVGADLQAPPAGRSEGRCDG